MGTGWSQEEGGSQQSEQPDKKTSQSTDISAQGTPQVTRRTVKLPHRCDEILRDADTEIDRSSTEKLCHQLQAGVYLKQKRQKYWVDKNFKNCFILYAKDLKITWAEDSRYWHWPSMKEESSDVSFDAAELLNVCWLEVHGRFETSKLSPGTTYEVVFIAMLKESAYGWEIPVNLRLILPNGSSQQRKENLMEKQKGRWVEIPAGHFTTSLEHTGDLEISLYEYEGGKWKRGLVIKGVSIRPKS